MARIRAVFTFRGDKPGAREEFYGKLNKSYPKSFRIEDDESFSLSVKGDCDPQAAKEMLKSFVPKDKLVSYRFQIDVDGKRLEFGGP